MSHYQISYQNLKFYHFSSKLDPETKPIINLWGDQSYIYIYEEKQNKNIWRSDMKEK